MKWFSSDQQSSSEQRRKNLLKRALRLTKKEDIDRLGKPLLEAYSNWRYRDPRIFRLIIENPNARHLEEAAINMVQDSGSETGYYAVKEYISPRNEYYKYAVRLLMRIAQNQQNKSNIYYDASGLIIENKLTDEDSQKLIARMMHKPSKDIAIKLKRIWKKRPELRETLDSKVRKELGIIARFGTCTAGDIELIKFYLENNIFSEDVVLPKLMYLARKTEEETLKFKVLEFFNMADSKRHTCEYADELIGLAVKGLDDHFETSSKFLKKALRDTPYATLDKLSDLSYSNTNSKAHFLHETAEEFSLPELKNIAYNYLSKRAESAAAELFTDSRRAKIKELIAINNLSQEYLSVDILKQVFGVLIEDTDAAMRADAAELLGTVGGQYPEKVLGIDHLVYYLIENLDDRSYDVCAKAAEAIGKIGAANPSAVAEAIPRLAAVRERDSGFNKCALLALERIASSNAALVAPHLDDIIETLDKQYTSIEKEYYEVDSRKRRFRSMLSSACKITKSITEGGLEEHVLNISQVFPTLEKYHEEMKQNELNPVLTETRLRLTERLPPSPSTKVTAVKVSDKAVCTEEISDELPEPEELLKEVPLCSGAIAVKTGVGYRGGTVNYKVKIENNTPHPINDLRILPLMGDEQLFSINKGVGRISLLKPGESKTSEFILRPTGECGNIEILAQVTYYDAQQGEYLVISSDAKKTAITCPLIKSKPISAEVWDEYVNSLLLYSEDTSAIAVPCDTLSSKISEAVRSSLNLSLIFSDTNLLGQYERKLTQKFYGEGIKGLRYAVQVDVIGTGENSRVAVKAFAENEQALAGFYHKLLDEIDKEVEGLKDRINVNIYNIQDSVIMRSNLGSGSPIKLEGSIVIGS